MFVIIKIKKYTERERERNFWIVISEQIQAIITKSIITFKHGCTCYKNYL